MAGWTTTSFGTMRGAARLGLSYLQVASGQAHVVKPDPATVRRLVFLCHGNICRSPYGEAIAKARGWETASFGLSTTTGNPAHPPIAEYAAEKSIDLSDHRATAVQDFTPQDGDLLIAMEVRHLAKLAAHPELRAFPRVLLGSYHSPPMHHLHDPYSLDPAYLPTCMDRVERATNALCDALSAPTPSPEPV